MGSNRKELITTEVTDKKHPKRQELQSVVAEDGDRTKATARMGVRTAAGVHSHFTRTSQSSLCKPCAGR